MEYTGCGNGIELMGSLFSETDLHDYNGEAQRARTCADVEEAAV